MKSSSFDRIATLKNRAGTVPDDYGVLDPATAPGRTIRLHMLDNSAQEDQHGSGLVVKNSLSARMRYTSNVAVGDTITMSGTDFEIIEVKELGRRAYLDLRLQERP